MQCIRYVATSATLCPTRTFTYTALTRDFIAFYLRAGHREYAPTTGTRLYLGPIGTGAENVKQFVFARVVYRVFPVYVYERCHDR